MEKEEGRCMWLGAKSGRREGTEMKDVTGSAASKAWWWCPKMGIQRARARGREEIDEIAIQYEKRKHKAKMLERNSNSEAWIPYAIYV